MECFLRIKTISITDFWQGGSIRRKSLSFFSASPPLSRRLPSFPCSSVERESSYRRVARFIEFQHTGSLIHLAIKRRADQTRIRILYYLYDLAGLVISAIAAILINDGIESSVRQFDQHARFVVSFVACEMIVLHVLRVYRRVWSRSTMGEFILVGVGMLAGGAVAGTICQKANGELTWNSARLAIVAVGFASWLVLIPRAMPEIIRELAIESSHRHPNRRRNSSLQLLVYGAGDMGNLFV